MGSKTRARELMQAAGVPIVPGTTEPVATVGGRAARSPRTRSASRSPSRRPAAAAARASAWRSREDELEGAFEGASREGEKFFSDGTVYLERYLPDPRHVEVQVLADRHGNVIHLGERDCSIQRRHQKVIEESPAPAVDAGAARADRADRRGRGDGRRLRRRGHDRGAVLAPADGKGAAEYFFLEMNTRVQVEHCVTEMTTGMDIVKEGIRAAAGEQLSYTPGGRRAARARDRVPDQRRGRIEELRPGAGQDRRLPRARRPRRARRLGRRARAARSRRCTTRWSPS